MPRKTQLARWNEKWIEVESGCHEWQAAKNSEGYGNFWDKRFQTMRGAHRVGWEMLMGEVPDNMEIDHICKNKACVRLDHLRMVTGSQNTMYGHGSTLVICKYGHTGGFRERPGYGRQCIECSRIKQNEYHSRKRERELNA